MSDIDWTKRTCIVHNLSFRMTAQMNVFYNEESCISEILESNILLVLKHHVVFKEIAFWK